MYTDTQFISIQYMLLKQQSAGINLNKYILILRTSNEKYRLFTQSHVQLTVEIIRKIFNFKIKK